MKRVAIVGERRAELKDVPDLEPHDDWAVVRVEAAPMCTEYKSFVTGRQTDSLGHEASGEVVAVDSSSRVHIGDRVVVMPGYPCGKCVLCLSGEYVHCEHKFDIPEGMMAEYVLKQDWLLLPIPEGMSYERASLACCALGPSFGALQRVGLTAFDTLLVTGAGPVGLGAVVNAAYIGATIIVAELEPSRAMRARTAGASVVVDPSKSDAVETIKELTDGVGVDCAIDCSGNVQAQRLCLDATRRKGRIVFVGEANEDLFLRIGTQADMLRTGHTLIGSWHYNLRDYPRVMKVIAESPLVESLISDILPMTRIQAAFELSASGQRGKIILQPGK